MSNESRGQRQLQAVQGEGLRLLRGRGAQSAHALVRVKRNERTESQESEEEKGEEQKLGG